MLPPPWKMVWRFLKKLGIKPPYDPAIPLLGIYPEETKVEKDTYIPLFIAALFTIARTMGYMCLFQFWFPQDICLGVGLLDHMVALFLVF